ncbi:type II pantothenate kinase [Ornithinibacillus halophilus]|uniref:Pantothenate kinase n=1 Tax=Ornithinibacillus halophilus TaxID=930117 RepID=A0A1M5FKG2_9BACI|nr:type II pantothenate kinase [Ornithinibacillus halophilus]SHF91993.1 pantothenate kinase [Ornithinibacillus halophilus]
MVQKIGIDAGGSLTKVAYEENGRLHVKTFSNQKMNQLIQWLHITAPNAIFHITGGKSGLIQSSSDQKSIQIEEFQATIQGTNFLLGHENVKIEDEYILVSIGTGTSIYHVTESSFDRILGTGIGGGTLVGLGSILSGEKSYHRLVEMARSGKRNKRDLLVKDIYSPDESPILGELTAANFGKAHMQESNSINDNMASLIQMIGETIITVACQAAAIKQIDKIVFVGSTLSGNDPLRNVLISFRNLYPYEPVFLDKGAYAGAIGALIHK